MTRIIGGTAGGRRLVVPEGQTRPTSDRAREGIFSTMESLVGSFARKRVLDLYAGSGALGLESRSRGAADVILVDNNEKAIRACKQNITTLGLDGVVAIRQSAEHFLANCSDSFDIVFADPPYAVPNPEVESLVQAILPRLTGEGVVAIERSSRGPGFPWPVGYEALRQRSYGEAIVYYARLSPAG